MIRWIALALCLAGLPAAGQVALELPVGAVETARTVEDPGRYRLPTGRYGVDVQPSQVLEGRVITRAWRIPRARTDTLALLRLIRTQVQAAGYEIIFDCDTTGCGGFDYRFNTPVLPPPQMEFDLADFRALSAQRVEGPAAFLSILISRSGRGSYVQAIDVIPEPPREIPLAPPTSAAPATNAAPADTPVAVVRQLTETGRLILDQVRFPAGVRTLDDAAIESLQPLADALSANADLAIVLVGHTDNAGTLAANIALSRSRAQAVRSVLVGRYGIAPNRIGAEGAGYLVPLHPNTSDENRAANRRVEAILR